MTTKVEYRDVRPQEALQMMGWDLRRPCRGRVQVGLSAGVKTYSARYRYGDGHLLCRIGRLTHARAVFINGEFSLCVFKPEPA